mmetsp:Transcript_47383/g.139935  ORF Transcript_47383/g.139935 Transcript_47383/m.139935 type:complete len:357 (+) Transcript_47383:2154-3224(+)
MRVRLGEDGLVRDWRSVCGQQALVQGVVNQHRSARALAGIDHLNAAVRAHIPHAYDFVNRAGDELMVALIQRNLCDSCRVAVQRHYGPRDRRRPPVDVALDAASCHHGMRWAPCETADRLVRGVGEPVAHRARAASEVSELQRAVGRARHEAAQVAQVLEPLDPAVVEAHLEARGQPAAGESRPLVNVQDARLVAQHEAVGPLSLPGGSALLEAADGLWHRPKPPAVLQLETHRVVQREFAVCSGDCEPLDRGHVDGVGDPACLRKRDGAHVLHRAAAPQTQGRVLAEGRVLVLVRQMQKVRDGRGMRGGGGKRLRGLELVGGGLVTRLVLEQKESDQLLPRDAAVRVCINLHEEA